MENYAGLISDVPSLDEQRAKPSKPLKEVAEKQHWIARANGVIDLICRDQGCSRDQAIAWLADYWATKEGIDLGHDNPLLDPAEYGQQPELKMSRIQGAWQWLNEPII